MGDTQNPFAVQTPEDLDPETVVSLFVDVFSDFSAVGAPGHTFLHGPRGSGKTMMFRYLEPDCQRLRDGNVPLHEQKFFGVLLPIKKTDLNVMELIRLEDTHANSVLNEHLLTVAVAARTFAALRKAAIPDIDAHRAELARLFNGTFVKLLSQAGWPSAEGLHADVDEPVDGLLARMQDVCDQMYIEASRYLRRLSFLATTLPYNGALTGYLDFMVPLAQGLKPLSFMPDGPVYLLIDDADNLNETQTRILNTWVSYRTIGDVSLKISTQMRYKTYATVFGRSIDAPHDYSDITISAVYTGRGKNNYRQRIDEIVQRRLRFAGINTTPEDFFPPDEAQEKKIQAIATEIRTNWNESGRGYRANDDVTRYARPNYIKSLRGRSKSGSSYSYAGFEQLVHISDGVIRHFLEAASRMWSATIASAPNASVTFIPPHIQNQVVRDMAGQLMDGFDKLALDEEANTSQKLKNLVEALGGLFQQIMLSDRSERRAFSIAFSDRPDDEVMKVLELGVQYGFLQRKWIGNKEGTGRTTQYILSRRLAPHFTLDPTSFAGYQFVTNDKILRALDRPKSLVRAVRALSEEEISNNPQPELFEVD